MAWMTNEVLFYGGIAIATGALTMAIIYLVYSHIRYIHLNMQLDNEYGKKEN